MNPLVFGTHDSATVEQLMNCLNVEEGSRGVLCADGHVGYSMPIGGVVGYRRHVSPAGVGFDIGCGNLAVKTDLLTNDIPPTEFARWADEIARQIPFGMGRSNDHKVDSPVIDWIGKSPVSQQKALQQLAANQLGTVGSGNHYVDVFSSIQDGHIWIGCHFGSRGFGHKTATMFLNVAKGLPMDAQGSDGEMMSAPLLLDIDQPSGADYIAAMELAGTYAMEGRKAVVDRVRAILGAGVKDYVHNHHNYAWRETHNGEDLWVVRKGATPAFPGQRGFVGGSMGDFSVILKGVESDVSRDAMYSTVHGAGRVMSRMQAKKGKSKWVCSLDAKMFVPCTVEYQTKVFVPCTVEYQTPRQPPKNLKCPVHGLPLMKVQVTAPVNFRDVQDKLVSQGIELRGAGPDESPQVYRSLADVLAAHAATIEVENVLIPRIVVMAGADVYDPFKD